MTETSGSGELTVVYGNEISRREHDFNENLNFI